MRFGPVPVAEAVGAILAHSQKAGGKTIKKGTVLTTDHVAALTTAGIERVFVARLETGDVHEDEAAARIAGAVAGDAVRVDDPFTGRANLFASGAGLFIPDRELVDRLNAIHPAITIASLDAFERVEAGRMVATVKIIPFSAPAAAVAEAEAVARSAPVATVAPFRLKSVGVVATTLPMLKASVLDKTRRILDERLAPTGAAVSEEIRVPHSEEALTAAIRKLAPECDCVIVFGASAIVDEADVVPAAIVAAGGRIVHFGMPVDPGNLLLLADLGGVPVLGAPGCARSPRENGFDWILDRILAGMDVSPDDIRGLGVGGLLMEIVTRPQPRRQPAPIPRKPERIGAVVLAAGRSSRMGGANKLLLPVAGEAMVRGPVTAALAAGLAPVVVVTGQDAHAVGAVLEGLDVKQVNNPDYAKGLSTSLACGIAALDDGVEAAFILLGDMPFVGSDDLCKLADAIDPAAGGWIAVPRTEAGDWGNPVLFHRRFFSELENVRGDRGAREVLERNRENLVFVDLPAARITRDLDTRQAYQLYSGDPLLSQK